MPLLWKEGGSFPKFILLPFLYIPCYYRTCISRRILSMSYKIPMKVAEIQLTYSNRVKAEDRPQITSSRDAYWVLESNWRAQMGLVEEFNILAPRLVQPRDGHVPDLQRRCVRTVLNLKIVFAAALKGRASSIILPHNHPSGNLSPSHMNIDRVDEKIRAGRKDSGCPGPEPSDPFSGRRVLFFCRRRAHSVCA